jgi:FG-GAP repeat
MRTVRTTALLVVATLSVAAALPASAAVTAHNKRMHKLIVLDDPLKTANDSFGHQVAIDAAGNEVLVGAHLSDGGSGRAYLYTAKSGTWSATPTAKFSDPVAGANHFGFSVVLSSDGKTAFIAADLVKVGGRTGAGAVYEYKSTNGVWPKTPTLTLRDPGKGTNDYFGVGVSLSSDGGTLVVGSPGVTRGTVAEVGAAYVYTASHGTFPTTPSATIPSPVSTLNLFGYSTSVSDNVSGKGTVVIGAYATTVSTANDEGAAYIYDSKGLHSWKLAAGGSLKDPGHTSADFFGGVVAIDSAGTTVLVGAQDETEKGVADAGAVFDYRLTSGVWKPRQTLDGPANGPANFAYPSISANGAVAIAAAPSAQVNGHAGAGEAFVYGAVGTAYALGATVPDPTGGSANSPEYFGNWSAVNATGTMTVIAAPATGGTGGTNGPGAVYVYSIS